MTSSRKRRFPVGLGVMTAIILTLTLWPMGSTSTSSSLCLVCGSKGASDALRNLLLFVPVGYLTRRALPRHWPSFVPYALVATLSLAIEIAQIGISGRDASLGDVLFNSAGGAAGVLAAAHLSSLLDPGQRLRRRLLLGAIVASLAAVAVTGFLLQPSFPESVYFGQWTPELGHLETYDGRVLEASVGDIAVGSGRLTNGTVVRDGLVRRETIDVLAVAGRPTPGLASVFSIYDGDEREIVLLGIDGSDVAFRFRTRASTARLSVPDLRLASGMEGTAPGDSVRFTVRADGRKLCIAAGPHVRCRLSHGIGRGWVFLHYREAVNRGLAGWLDMAWLLLLFLPVGYWARNTGPFRPACLAAVAALPVIGLATGATGNLTGVLLGAAAGLLLGWALGPAGKRLAHSAGENRVSPGATRPGRP